MGSKLMTEEKAYASLVHLLEQRRDRDDLQGHYLGELLKTYAPLYPSQYRKKWLNRLRQQPEGYWLLALRHCKSIEALEFWYDLVPCAQFGLTLNGVTDDDVKYLSRLSAMKRVCRLKLRSKNMSTSSVRFLLSKRCQLDNLRWLALYGDPARMGDACARLFAETKKFKQLETLFLTYNDIGEEGALLFAASKHYTSLKRLELIRPELFTEVGLRAMATAQGFGAPIQAYHKHWLDRYFPEGQ